MRLLIAGSRSLKPSVAEIGKLVSVTASLVICGCATGADRADHS
jgi:hypothetical protein